jgi:hypothetical protein
MGKWYLETVEAFELYRLEHSLEYLLLAMTVPDARSDNCHVVILVMSYCQYQCVFEFIQSTVDCVHQIELKSSCVKEHGTLDVAIDAGPVLCIGCDCKLSSQMIQLQVRQPGITVREMMHMMWEIFEKHNRNINCELMRHTNVLLFVHGTTHLDHLSLMDVDSTWLYEHLVGDVGRQLAVPP